MELLNPLRALAAPALTAGAVLLSVVTLLLLGRDLGNTKFGDGSRQE